MERTWGEAKLAVFDEEEARKWVLGVSQSQLRTLYVNLLL